MQALFLGNFLGAFLQASMLTTILCQSVALQYLSNQPQKESLDHTIHVGGTLHFGVQVFDPNHFADGLNGPVALQAEALGFLPHEDFCRPELREKVVAHWKNRRVFGAGLNGAL